jgi:UDP-N-acetylmuramate: L-alanyl-gamma-D-glutamyl-meso-diaminopimelate ligase
MAKSDFSIAATTPLSSLPKGGRIHVIGVSGVAMAQLAVELGRKGFLVSGSDKDFYEPMGSFLKNSAITLFKGYQEDNVPPSVDLVVIGNAVSYENPEVQAVEQRKLPYTCFPKVLQETIIAGKHSIVVTGTHGKSTTTALLASTLLKLGGDPSYFVGGIAQDLPMSLARGKGQWSVVEGDEYDSAFFAKVPKFSFYVPDTCIINAIEYDHADIYPDVESIVREFRGLLERLPAHGTAYCCVDYPHVRGLVAELQGAIKATIITFGCTPDADVYIESRLQDGLSQKIAARGKGIGALEFAIPQSGVYNAKNALVTLLVAMQVGFNREDAIQAVSTFRAVKRRQEVRFNKAGVVLIEDFAHHPTAVHETLSGLREAFPRKKIWAVFEPRSNTSRRKVFQESYVKAFRSADCAIVCNVESRSTDADQELIDVATLVQEIKTTGVRGEMLPNAQEIEAFLLKEIGTDDLIVLMSNGSFGGLPRALEQKLNARFPQ